MPKKKNINLLPKEGLMHRLLGDCSAGQWVHLHNCHYYRNDSHGGIFKRFWLDAQNSDLNDEIRFASSQIDSPKILKFLFEICKKIAIYQELGKDKKI